MTLAANAPFLRIPPFPGRRADTLAHPGTTKFDTGAVLEHLKDAMVGGTYWGCRPDFGPSKPVVFAPRSMSQLDAMLRIHGREHHDALLAGPAKWGGKFGLRSIDADTDPWHIARHASQLIADSASELAAVATIFGTPTTLFVDNEADPSNSDVARMLEQLLGGWEYRDPFDGRSISAIEAIALLRSWRTLINSNRDIKAIFGIAPWKRVTVDALLWDGTGPVRHRKSVPAGLGAGDLVACWKSRTDASTLRRIEATGAQIAEIEDGFIRSSGLGANCVPPLSIIVDRTGIYFDPGSPSDLESILQNWEFDQGTLSRADALARTMVTSSISKYGSETAEISLASGQKRRVLVTGQVEDDRSIISGGAGFTNLALLTEARAREAGSWLLYKPHPDVQAGHRKGHVDSSLTAQLADEMQVDTPIAPLIESVDALSVITSLAGFEALMRGKDVTTYGVPFYAGWGLTHDQAAIPTRRNRNRTLSELVAATLLIYPRYVDPVTRLPCTAELLVKRMQDGHASVRSPLVTLREWQGKIQLFLHRLIGRHR